MHPLIKTVVGFIALAICPCILQAQKTPYLEKKINLHTRNIPLGDVFKLVENQTGVVFSYNPKQLNDQRNVSMQYTKMPLRLVLDELMKVTGCTYKTKNNYIILLCDSKPYVAPVTASVLSGYIYNSSDSTVLENASIYLTSGKYAAVSNEYGYFSISFSKSQTNLQLSVAKENFKDTSFVIKSPAEKNIKLFLSPENEITYTPPVDTTPPNVPDTSANIPAVVINTDTVLPEKKLSFWPNINKMKVNLKNIKDTFLNQFSLSLFPPISTNKLLAFNTVNNFSLNLLVGYSKGVRYLEIGGLVNVDDGDVSYVQVGGLGNSISGSVTGVQVGGLYSVARKNTDGVQVGGLYSKTGLKVDGVQVGGLFSDADTVDGFQLGGLFAHTRSNVSGAQIGGLFSKADTVDGFQLGGMFNRAQSVSGAQVSGFLNYAHHMDGFQLSFINIAHEADGVSFGFFNFVKKGYHKIEVSTTELKMVNLGFRTGVDHLHNVFFAGIGVDGANRTWTYGYALGSSFALGKKWKISTDLSSQQVNLVGQANKHLDLTNKLWVALEFYPSKKFSIALGPSYNIRVADTRAAGYATAIDTDLVKYISDHDEGGGSFINTKTWIGAGFALRFL